MGYKYYTKGQAVKVSDHFYSTEFDCHGSGCCSKTIVNEKLIEYLERIRNHFNASITITSGYRCPTHNSSPSVGGATGSRHTKGDAADIVVKDHAPKEVAQYAESIGVLGIGLYETANDGYFVHIDTRTTKSFWYGQGQVYRSTFGGTVSSLNTGTTTSVTTTSTTYKMLTRGSSGEDVKELQKKLNDLGCSCGTADGFYGANTENAVRSFQRNKGLVTDGVAGVQTLTAIDKAIKELDSKNSSGSLIGCNVKVTASLLNVRSGAGTNNRIMCQIKNGTICTVVQEDNGWCKLESPSGWVSKDYIERT